MTGADTVLICESDGTIVDLVDEKEAGEGVEEFTGILCPGFINCHCHLELSHMKGLIPEGTGLVDFVFSIVTQRGAGEEVIKQAIVDAEDEMLRNGIVAVGDICNNLDTLAQKERQRLFYYNFIEASGWLPAGAQARFDRAKFYYDVFSADMPSSIVPHAPYSVSDDLWKLIQPFFRGKVASIHNQETSFEDELFIQNSGDFVRMYEMMKLDTSFFRATGKSSLQTYFDKLGDAEQIILVHNTFTKEADIQYVKERRNRDSVSYCLCINANKYIEDAVPPLELLMSNECNIVIGTDSLASNHNLSILDEMKTIERHFPAISKSKILTWATSNGANALGISDSYGSFEKGKKPGVILIESDSPRHQLTFHTATPKRLL